MKNNKVNTEIHSNKDELDGKKKLIVNEYTAAEETSKKKIDNDKFNTNSASFISGFKSYHHLLRFLIAVIVIWCVIFFSVLILIKNYQEIGVQFTLNDKGFPVIAINNAPRIASVAVPANQVWVNTGLEFEPGQKAILHATGSVNLAIHHLVEAAELDFKPKFPWVGPDGSTINGMEKVYGTTGVYKDRSKVKLDSAAPYGFLLAYIGPKSKMPPSMYNPRPSEIKKVGNYGEIEYSSEQNEKGILYLVVNDDVLGPNDRDIYISNEKARKTSYGINAPTTVEMNSRWIEIEKENYWNIWYDDNIGNFVVHVQYLRNKNK
ncbi:MAG: hypothetical protein JW866_10590 [Ignavibacteriales bacterium]|nr:hypothetical protein [Ignavibacteriales bacterium]